MTWYSVLCHALSNISKPFKYIVSFHIISYHFKYVISFERPRAPSCSFVQFRAVSCRFGSFRAVSCRFVSFGVVWCRFMRRGSVRLEDVYVTRSFATSPKVGADGRPAGNFRTVSVRPGASWYLLQPIRGCGLVKLDLSHVTRRYGHGTVRGEHHGQKVSSGKV